MQAKKEEIEKQGVAIVVISFAEPAKLAVYQRRHRWPFLLLADPERHAYGLFGLGRLLWRRLFSPSTVKLYLHILRKGRKLQSYGREDYYQTGGDFLLDRNGRVLFARRSQDPADRPRVGELLDEIRKFRNPSMGSYRVS